MKKSLLLAVMLAVVAIVAVPALAQDKGRGAEHDGAGSGGSSEIPAIAPTKGSESGGCSDADKISLRSAPADDGGDDGGSVTAASAPGCSEFPVE